MASTITPTWTDNVTVKTLASLARAATSRSTLDLRTKWGAYVFARIGRGGTTALSSGIVVLARRTINNDAISHVGGAAAQLVGQVAAAISTTCAAAGNAAGVSSLTVASTTSYAAGDLIFVAAAAPAAADSEWCRVADITSATVFLLDEPTRFAHNNVAHTVRNKADMFTFWLEGGATYEIVFDYGDPAAGDTAYVEAWAQTLDSVAAS